MSEKPERFAVLSHILPPAPSGQAMVLQYLHRNISGDACCFLSRHDYGDELKNSHSYHWLKPLRRLPEFGPLFVLSLIATINALAGIFWRARQIEQVIRTENIHAIVACSGDLYDIPASALACKRTGIPCIPYLFDDYVFQWTGFRRRLASVLEKYVFRSACGAIVTNEFLQEEYQSRYGIKCQIIRNPCVIKGLSSPEQAHTLCSPGEKSIVYTGSVYHAHYDAFRNMIAAIAELQRDDVRLHIYTSQPETELQDNGIGGPAVVYHHHIPQAEVQQILGHATILFLPLAFTSTIPEVIKTSSPGKTGEYLAAGRPVIVHAPDDSFVSWYFRENLCGVVVGRDSASALASEVGRILDDQELQKRLGITARQTAERDFDVESIGREYIEFVASVQKCGYVSASQGD